MARVWHPLLGMAAIWKGSIAFGLVNVPVELRSAVRSDHISFRLLHKKDKTPVKYERVRQDDGKEVKWDEIVKGYEREKGDFVVLTQEDFKAAAVKRSESLDLTDFVDADEIDPRFFETPYFLIPAKGGTKAYAVLREAMRKANVVGIGTIILRQKQHLAGMHVVGDAIVLDLMRFANEIVPASEYSFPPGTEARDKEIEMALKLIESLHGPFEPEKYVDTYRANLLRIIEAKGRGKKPQLEPMTAEIGDGKVLDLMAKLEASLKQGRPAKAGGRTTKRKTATRRERRSA
ncbi:MAG TPA: Ku protein [Gemmatimonadaceae bacterium]|nr:Ku protein [Gemmatimonadaceae bacterium]